MSFSIKYLPLFKVDILHFYFLDRGLVEYNSLDANEKARLLQLYDFQSFFTVKPSLLTQKALKGHNLLFKTSNNGFIIWSKLEENNDNVPFISLNDDLNFTFLIQINDSDFFNYTNLKLDKASNIKFFSNRIHHGETGTFPLINIVGDNIPVNDKYNLSPVNEQNELLALTNFEKDKLFGLIRIYMKGNNASLNVTNLAGSIPEPAITFELIFDNRTTFWRYIFKKDQLIKPVDDVKFEDGDSKTLLTKTKKPLTQNGFVSVKLDGKELPNPDSRMIIPTNTTNKYFSEIYM